MIVKACDAAEPPTAVPGGIGVVMGYVGRAAYTPHVWTLEEWDRLAAVPQIPIWVPDLASAPAAEAAAAVAAVEAIGWAPHQEDARIIVFDVETNSGLRAWWPGCAGYTEAAGYTPVMYGSLSTVLLNAAADLLVADWDAVPELLAGQTIHGHQYRAGVQAAGTVMDLSVIDEWMFARAGLGKRHAG